MKDVFNADETGLFFRGLPEKSLVVKKDERKGDKKAKERITLLLCCSATGEKLEPLIIGKSANPRCFRGINVRTLNIRYESNRRARMTRDIFVAWLKSLNNKFRRQNRKILLFVDNCSAHPDIQLSNIKLKFFRQTLLQSCSHVTQGLYKPSRPIIAFNLSIIFYGISMNAHPLQNWPSQSRS